MSVERFERILVVAFAVLVLANALAAGLRTVADSDTGWHLATGRYVWEHHTIPSTAFAFSDTDYPSTKAVSQSHGLPIDDVKTVLLGE